MSERAPDRCPCCGGSLAMLDGVRWMKDARTLLWPSGSAFFTHREAEFLDVLWGTLGTGAFLSAPRMVARAYAAEVDGGPEWPCANVWVHRLRSKIKRSGLVIQTTRGTDGGYRLVWRGAPGITRVARAA